MSPAFSPRKFGWDPWVSARRSNARGRTLGALLTLPAIRLHRIYLGLFTLAFGELLRLFIINEQALTNGPSGMGLSRVAFAGPLASAMGIAITTLAILTAVYFGLVLLLRSRFGLYIRAVRDDQQVGADARGVNVALWKLWSFVHLLCGHGHRGRNVCISEPLRLAGVTLCRLLLSVHCDGTSRRNEHACRSDCRGDLSHGVAGVSALGRRCVWYYSD